MISNVIGCLLAYSISEIKVSIGSTGIYTLDINMMVGCFIMSLSLASLVGTMFFFEEIPRERRKFYIELK